MNPFALVFELRGSTAHFLESREAKIGLSWALTVRKTGYCSNIDPRIPARSLKPPPQLKIEGYAK
jgi:hypothetical protein